MPPQTSFSGIRETINMQNMVPAGGRQVVPPASLFRNTFVIFMGTSKTELGKKVTTDHRHVLAGEYQRCSKKKGVRVIGPESSQRCGQCCGC